YSLLFFCPFFFFQAEDGIRDFHVTGVQTCALPIYLVGHWTEGLSHLVRRSAACRHRGGHPVVYQEALSADIARVFPDPRSLCRRSEERRVGKECRSWWSADE